VTAAVALLALLARLIPAHVALADDPDAPLDRCAPLAVVAVADGERDPVTPGLAACVAW
jgi:hypothetical protein